MKGNALIRFKEQRILKAVDGMVNIVEGCLSRDWRSPGGRLKDTPQWCELYVAWSSLRREEKGRK